MVLVRDSVTTLRYIPKRNGPVCFRMSRIQKDSSLCWTFHYTSLNNLTFNKIKEMLSGSTEGFFVHH